MQSQSHTQKTHIQTHTHINTPPSPRLLFVFVKMSKSWRDGGELCGPGAGRGTTATGGGLASAAELHNLAPAICQSRAKTSSGLLRKDWQPVSAYTAHDALTKKNQQRGRLHLMSVATSSVARLALCCMRS